MAGSDPLQLAAPAFRYTAFRYPAFILLSHGAQMKKTMLDLLVCPDDHSTLTYADAELLSRLNTAIASGKLRNRAGQTLDRPLDAALVRADAVLAYPVVDDIPLMLIDKGILLAQLDG
jgi:uncharacterized protein YbaR (Trm112 family)